MFTGLIEDVGILRQVRRGGESYRLLVETAFPMTELSLGESISINGICLTVVEFGGGLFQVDVSPETLSRSALADVKPGTPVNLERALCFGDRLGGHLVSGHVDGVATVTRRFTQENAIVFVFATDADILRFIVEKGSVAIDGISLTVNAVGEQDFSVSIIPHSLEQTTLKERKVGDRVNIETDLIGKYVARLLVPKGTKGKAERGGMDPEFLARNGFL